MLCFAWKAIRCTNHWPADRYATCLKNTGFSTTSGSFTMCCTPRAISISTMTLTSIWRPEMRSCLRIHKTKIQFPPTRNGRWELLHILNVFYAVMLAMYLTSTSCPTAVRSARVKFILRSGVIFLEIWENLFKMVIFWRIFE